MPLPVATSVILLRQTHREWSELASFSYVFRQHDRAVYHHIQLTVAKCHWIQRKVSVSLTTTVHKKLVIEHLRVKATPGAKSAKNYAWSNRRLNLCTVGGRIQDLSYLRAGSESNVDGQLSSGAPCSNV